MIINIKTQGDEIQSDGGVVGWSWITYLKRCILRQNLNKKKEKKHLHEDLGQREKKLLKDRTGGGGPCGWKVECKVENGGR